MSNYVSKTNPNPIPKVLLQAKKEATEKRDKDLNMSPWDKGHWANRQ
ncbi:MAG: hypothetical protein HQ537_01095 [Parcubacteria group bacterium]|nr:hypothetical protein [Parcubacteria group bacterium]